MTDRELIRRSHSLVEPKLDVVCFGALIRCWLLMADTPLVLNGGARVSESLETFGDDAVIIAAMLSQWGVSAGLITSMVGEDEAGRELSAQLDRAGVKAELRYSTGVATPVEISICDPTGTRTYLQQYRDEALVSLDSANLTPLQGTRLLYVDSYDGPPILKPMRYAHKCGIPVFLNLESRYQDFDLMEKLMPYATVCQVSMDEPTAIGSAQDAAARVLGWGAKTVLVTDGADGCIAATLDEAVSVNSPSLDTAYGHGAGAAFSAGFIFAHLQGGDLEWCARFATAEAHLKCHVLDYRAYPVEKVSELAGQLQTERT